jgi:hypothetical protein
MNIFSAVKKIKIPSNRSIRILRNDYWMKIIWRTDLQKGGFGTRPYVAFD